MNKNTIHPNKNLSTMFLMKIQAYLLFTYDFTI